MSGMIGTDKPENASAPSARIDWVDCSRGWCILLVVAMHTIMGVSYALGAMGWPLEIVAFAKPFRMPDFFLIAGLFAHRAIDRTWPEFLDRKIVFFAYFYCLWVLIIYGVKQGLFGVSGDFALGYLFTFVQPFPDLWFIHLLPFLYLAARLTDRLPILAVMAGAIVAHVIASLSPSGGVYTMSSNLTGWTTPDSFMLFLVFFLIGHYWRKEIFTCAALAVSRPAIGIVALVIWAIANGLSIRFGYTEIPGLTLIYGCAGALAVIVTSALLAKMNAAKRLNYLGRRSLFIYISFVLPMAATRIGLIKLGMSDVAIISAIVMTAAISGPLLLEWMTRNTKLAFLYHRPAWTYLSKSERAAAFRNPQSP